MTIKTARLTLEPLGTKHIDSTHRYSSDIENTRLMMFLPNDTREETLEFLKNSEREWASDTPSFYEFAVFLGNEHIGAVSLYSCEEQGVWEFGWIIDKSHWGQGYTLEAAEGIISAMTKRLDIKKYIAHCDSENKSSARVMEKLGMTIADVHGGRKNRSSDEERTEFRYERIV